MRHNEVLPLVIELCEKQQLDFPTRSKMVQIAVDSSTKEDVLDLVDYAGVIPERIDHDSTEEKLYAKFCDALLARALRDLGLRAQMIAERADAADVVADGHGYSMVGDAKAFRLSRTAKNQKDFKVEALDKWRGDADYACLLSPLYQYPIRESQIYHQAIRFNVCLLSYTHLAFLLRHPPAEMSALSSLWSKPATLTPSKNAAQYWAAIDSSLVAISQTTARDWIEAKSASSMLLPEQAQEQLDYWQEQRRSISSLPHSEAVRRLIQALKIDEKIQVIKTYIP